MRHLSLVSGPVSGRSELASALRLGTAQTAPILRRFTRNNVQHPTYKALAELGKAVKTAFLCGYLHTEALRREIITPLIWEHVNPYGRFELDMETRFLATHSDLRTSPGRLRLRNVVPLRVLYQDSAKYPMRAAAPKTFHGKPNP